MFVWANKETVTANAVNHPPLTVVSTVIHWFFLATGFIFGI